MIFRALILSFASLFLSMQVSFAESSMLLNGVEAADVVRALESQGMEGTIDIDDQGDPRITSKTKEGIKFLVQFYNCKNNTDAQKKKCETVQFETSYSGVKGLKLDKVNKYNEDWLFGRAYLTDGDLHMDYVMDAKGGVLPKNMENHVQIWLDAIKNLEKNFDM